MREDFMNVTDLTYLLSGYTPMKILVAVAALTATLIMKRRLPKTKWRKLLSATPFLIGMGVSLLSAAIRSDDCEFSQIVADGAATGSAATVMYAFISGFVKDGYEEVYLDSLVIEGMLAGYVAEDELAAAAKSCAEVLRECDDAEQIIKKLPPLLLSLSPNMREGEALLIAKTLANLLIASES